MTETDVYANYIKACEEFCMPSDFTPQDVKNELATKYTKKATNKPSSNTIKDWISNTIQGSNFKLTKAGRRIEYMNGDACVAADRKDLEDYLTMINSAANGGPGFNVGEIKATLGTTLKEWEAVTLQQLIKQISYDKTYEKYTTEFLRNLHNYWGIKEDFDVYCTLMKQWMWCVKRKVWNRDVRHHIWVNYFGTTGFGKSEFIKRFTKPFTDFYAEGGLEIFADQGREYKKFCNNFILFFDELSQNNQSSLADAKLTTNTLNAIKASVTGEEMDVRILGGQEQNKIKIRYTPISAANYHLYDIIYDETSMRRFFEFNVGRNTIPTKKDFDYLNTMMEHSIEAFKGINENNDDGYFDPETPIGKMVRSIQSHYLPTKTTVNVWIRKCNVKAGKTPSDLLYSEYKNWCKEFGYNARNLEGYNEILASRFGRNADGEILIDIDTTMNKEDNYMNDLEEKVKGVI